MSELSIYTIEPEMVSKEFDDIVVVRPFSLGGRLDNSEQFLRYIANDIGVVVVALELPFERAQLWPKQAFHDTCEQLVESLPASGRQLHGWGDSLSGVYVTGMQQYGNAPFSSVLVRDSFNLGPANSQLPDKPLSGYMRAISYLVRDAMVSTAENWLGFSEEAVALPPAILTDFEADLPFIETMRESIRQIWANGPIVQSTEAVDGVMGLASTPNLPLSIRAFEAGISGTKRQVDDFRNDIIANRARVSSGLLNLLDFTIEPGRHSQLLNANRAVSHLAASLRLGKEAA